MATRYRNAFFGFSGFVTSVASASKAQPAKTQKAAPGRVTSAGKKNGVQAGATRPGGQSKAA